MAIRVHPIVKTTAEIIAGAIGARMNCKARGMTSTIDWDEYLTDVEKNLLPSGSGIDNETKIDRDRSTGIKLYLTTAFHHMNEGGYYDGWTVHTIVVVPTFDGIAVDVKGCNRNEIKEYLGETFDHALSERWIERYNTESASRSWTRAPEDTPRVLPTPVRVDGRNIE